jgi:hypothetical protein
MRIITIKSRYYSSLNYKKKNYFLNSLNNDVSDLQLFYEHKKVDFCIDQIHKLFNKCKQ